MTSRSWRHVGQHLVDASLWLSVFAESCLSVVPPVLDESSCVLVAGSVPATSKSPTIHTSLADIAARFETPLDTMRERARSRVQGLWGSVKKRVGRKRRGASGKPVNVVPVLRPVTDCRLSDRLCPNQTARGMVGKRPGLRPPGKKGAEPVGRDPDLTSCRP